jgi:putative addiction module killer protein
MTLVEYLDADGRSPFADWFNRLDAQAAAKVSVALMRMELGNLANVKALGTGLSECKINWGPGYRLYFGRDGDTLIILLAGGTKRRQQKDIEAAQQRWADYKQRKKEGE